MAQHTLDLITLFGPLGLMLGLIVITVIGLLILTETHKD